MIILNYFVKKFMSENIISESKVEYCDCCGEIVSMYEIVLIGTQFLCEGCRKE